MKRLSVSIIFIFLIMAISHTSQAQVEGDCSNCHTMHNSQGGAEMAIYGGTSGENSCLTLGDCIGCHAYDTSGSANVVDIGGSLVPQVWHIAGTDLAAGNFKYIVPGSDDDTGHNLAGIDQEGNASMFPPPGDQHTTGITQTGATALTCAGVYGCHGDPTVTGNIESMKGAHHADDSSIDGNFTGTSYRFLKGVLGLENPTTAWRNVGATDHNEYKGTTSPGASDRTSPANSTISGFCAECHGYYQGSGSDETGGTASPWLRHSTDIALPTTSEYASYGSYNVLAPIARSILPSSPESNRDNAVVMCLSCHKAHGSPYYKILRWDYKNWQGGTDECNICHSSKDDVQGSAHGDTTDGVNRIGLSSFGYAAGNCAHCHEQHASVGGTEPVPAGGAASKYLCYQKPFNTQAGGFCMSCHRDSAGQQVGGYINNYDYSKTRGGENKSCPTSVMEAFYFINKTSRVPQDNCVSDVGSAHDLTNIRNDALLSNWGWGAFTAKINPCLGCHNSHRATEDYPCSLPSGHSDKATWEIWGDESGEKMADYLGAGEIYQPPYKVGKTTYERDADTQPNYVELCLECHQDQQTSFQHGTLSEISWGFLTYHAKKLGTVDWAPLRLPYLEGNNYVLCCTDCHEPHGSRNEWLLRTEVNGKTGIEINEAGKWWHFCDACHEMEGSPHATNRPDYVNENADCSLGGCHTHGVVAGTF